jgi:hypothetical protein
MMPYKCHKKIGFGLEIEDQTQSQVVKLKAKAMEEQVMES